MVAYEANPPPLLPASHTEAISSPSCSTSDQAPFLWPTKASEDGPRPWVPVPMQETWKKFLALSFGPTQLWPLQSFGD